MSALEKIKTLIGKPQSYKQLHDKAVSELKYPRIDKNL
jgi:hypothetical protein